MPERIPSFKGETRLYGEGLRIYESEDYPNKLIRVRSLQGLVDVPLSNDVTLSERLRPDAEDEISPSQRMELAFELLGVQKDEMDTLEEKYELNIVPYDKWIGEADGQEAVIYLASKMPGVSMDKAIEEGSRWINFERFPGNIWSNYGRAMSGLVRYYNDAIHREGFFLYELTEPKQWVCDEKTGDVVMTDIDPVISYHVPKIKCVDMERELEALYYAATELAREEYMPRNDVTRTKWMLEDLRER